MPPSNPASRGRTRLSTIGRNLVTRAEREARLRKERDDLIREMVLGDHLTRKEIAAIEGMPTYERIRQLTCDHKRGT